VTLVLTINGPETIWLLCDRRLTYEDRPPKDHARKLMFLGTPDGMAILGYAGLGATSAGTEPADWISNVLRGRSLPLESALGVLAEAMKRQIPRHLIQLHSTSLLAHCIVATAFIGSEAKLYSIDLVFSKDRKSYQFRKSLHLARAKANVVRTPRFGLAGSGSYYLLKDKKWARPLLRMVRACDQLQISPEVVADHLAGINLDVHSNMADGTVGPRCIVAWRNKKGGPHKGANAHFFYSGRNRERPDASIPTIDNGTDINAVCAGVLPGVEKQLKALLDKRPVEPLDRGAINEALNRLPEAPDEELR
jgi:hypothetical protein